MIQQHPTPPPELPVEPLELLTLHRGAARDFVSMRELVQQITELQIGPRLILNSTRYYDEADLRRAASAAHHAKMKSREANRK